MSNELNIHDLVHYDSESDVFYIVKKAGEEEAFREIAPGVNIELDSKGEVIGIEILNASQVFRPYFLPLERERERVGSSANHLYQDTAD